MNEARFKQIIEKMARETAKTVALAGSDVTLPDGTVVKAIADEDPESISRVLDAQEISEQPKGRPALFHFVPGTLPPDTRFLLYDGQRWSLQPTRSHTAANIKVRVVMLGFAGAIGGTSST